MRADFVRNAFGSLSVARIAAMLNDLYVEPCLIELIGSPPVSGRLSCPSEKKNGIHRLGGQKMGRKLVGVGHGHVDDVQCSAV